MEKDCNVDNSNNNELQKTSNSTKSYSLKNTNMEFGEEAVTKYFYKENIESATINQLERCISKILVKDARIHQFRLEVANLNFKVG